MHRPACLVVVAVIAAVAAPAAYAEEIVGVQDPAKNIGCYLGASGARCDIRVRDWSPPRKPATCVLDYGEGLAIAREATRGSFVCAGDTALGAGKALAHGTSIKRGGITCTSRKTGITCKNAGGHGFRISRASYYRF